MSEITGTAESAESADLRRLKSGRDWYGYLTLENFDAVTERIREMLTGHRYTWVSCHEGLRDFFPEVRTGQRLSQDLVVNREPLEDGTDWAHLTVADTYGVWGLSTTVPDQATARERRQAAWDGADEGKRASGKWEAGLSMTYLHFKHGRHDEGRIEIEHRNGYGDRLYWVISVEVAEDEAAGVAPASGTEGP